LEPGWNALNAYSNEYGKVLLNRLQNFHRGKVDILEFTRTWFELLKIREHQLIELMELYLEPGWNAWNTYSNEYGKVLLESGANFTYVPNQ
jgi:hypothetical protein